MESEKPARNTKYLQTETETKGGKWCQLSSCPFSRSSTQDLRTASIWEERQCMKQTKPSVKFIP